MPKIQLSDKHKIIIVVIILLLFLALSVFFWLRFNWWSGLLPFTVLFSPDIYKYAKRKIRVEWYRRQRKANGLRAQETPEKVKFVTLSEWLVTDMIDATCNKNYTSCGTAEHYNTLMCQYTDAKADDNIVSYKSLMKRKLSVSAIYTGIQFNIDILKVRYSVSSCEYLESIPPSWDLPYRPFTAETYLADCKYYEAALISKKIELDRIEKQLEGFFESDGATRTADQYTQHIEDLLTEMALIQPGTVYTLEGMKVSKLASLERARNRHIKTINEQIRKSKVNAG